MSIRTDILDKLAADFLTVTTGNGYNYTINSVVKQSVNLSSLDTTALNFAYLFALPATQDPNETNMWEWAVGFAVYFKTAGIDGDGDGLMRTEAEGIIDDIMTLFQAPANTIAYDPVESVFIESIEPYDQTPVADVGLVYGIIKINFIQ